MPVGGVQAAEEGKVKDGYQLHALLPPKPLLHLPLLPFDQNKTSFSQVRKTEFIIEKPTEFIAVEMRKFKTHNYPAGR
jgi:hypothetical protein